MANNWRNNHTFALQILYVRLLQLPLLIASVHCSRISCWMVGSIILLSTFGIVEGLVVETLQMGH